MLTRLLLVSVVLASCGYEIALGEEAEKFALIVATGQFNAPEMESDQVAFVEADAKALAERLSASGYVVETTLGKEATQTNVRERVKGLAKRGANKGTVVLALFGQGYQFATKKSCFCPCDVAVKPGRGKDRVKADGKTPSYEPDPKTVVALDEILNAFKQSPASHRVLIADCCRWHPSLPDHSRFATSLKLNQLPANTGVLLSCLGETSVTIPSESRGLFGKMLVETLDRRSGVGALPLEKILAEVAPAVDADAWKRVGYGQTPRLLAKGTVVLDMGPARLGPAAKGAKAGELLDIDVGDAKLTLVWCPPGKFIMGDDASREFQPAHSVELDGFWIGQTEVTQAQWKAVVGTEPWSGRQWVEEGPLFAASCIAYDAATEFCVRLTQIERTAGRLAPDQQYVLPTEAQWEYACRAGTETTYSFGESFKVGTDYAWIGGLEGNCTVATHAHVVATRKPNPWGIFDMHGNVSEWTADWFADYAKAPLKNPRGPAKGSDRVVRGECWEWPLVGSAYRHQERPDIQSATIGFRIARSAIPKNLP